MMFSQSMTSFENFRPEENWKCIDFDPFCSVRYGICLLLYYLTFIDESGTRISHIHT